MSKLDPAAAEKITANLCTIISDPNFFLKEDGAWPVTRLNYSSYTTAFYHDLIARAWRAADLGRLIYATGHIDEGAALAIETSKLPHIDSPEDARALLLAQLDTLDIPDAFAQFCSWSHATQSDALAWMVNPFISQRTERGGAPSRGVAAGRQGR